MLVRLILILAIVLTIRMPAGAAEEPDTSCRPVKDQYYSDRERGWYFREHCLPKKSEEPKQKNEVSAKSPKPKLDWALIQDSKYLDTLDTEQFKKLLDEAKGEAVYRPTKDKLLAYMKMQDYAREKSLVFAYVWRDVLLENPELDQTVKNPGSNYGALAKAGIQLKANRSIVAEMAETVGLFFFVSGDCPYCHKQAPIMNMFVQDYGISVRTISQDYCNQLFSNCTEDVGGTVFNNFNIKSTPTLLAVFKGHDDKPVFQPIATGIITEEDIVNRLIFYYQYHKTGQYPGS